MIMAAAPIPGMDKDHKNDGFRLYLYGLKQVK